MADIAVLKHFWCEGPGAFDDALTGAGHRLITVNLYAHAPSRPPRMG